jgi:hypothetical protein
VAHVHLPSISTNAIRILVTGAASTYSNIVEVEAWTATGSSTVQNIPPNVYLTSPADGVALTAPASVSVSATAGDGDGQITKVEFYRNSTLIGTLAKPSSGSPSAGAFNFTDSSVPAGTYSYTARAYDDRGAIATSSGRSVTVEAPVVTPPPPPPAPPPPMPHVGTRVPLSDGPFGPTWHVANPQLSPQYRGDRPFGNYRDILGWRRKGGDWLDANNVPNGPTPHATAQITSSQQAALSFDVRAVVQKLLANENTGILVRTTHWLPAAFASRENTSTPGPHLQVVTNMGTFTPPCIADTYTTSSGGDNGRLAKVHAPAMIKFDLSMIPAGATIQSATLTLRPISIYSGLPQTYFADYLDMPPLITDPAKQLGNVQGGVAATVAKDSDLAHHPDIMFYTQLESPAAIKENWGGDNGRNFLEHDYISWPEFGMKAMRHVIRSGQNVGAAMHKWTQPVDNASARPGTPWRDRHTRPYVYNQALGYDELYFRFMIRIDEDVYAGANEHVKLPGMSGIYEWSVAGAHTIPEPWGGKWYAALQHGRPASPCLIITGSGSTTMERTTCGMRVPRRAGAAPTATRMWCCAPGAPIPSSSGSSSTRPPMGGRHGIGTASSRSGWTESRCIATLNRTSGSTCRARSMTRPGSRCSMGAAGSPPRLSTTRFRGLRSPAATSVPRAAWRSRHPEIPSAR